jgi:phage tail sheath protein FI
MPEYLAPGVYIEETSFRSKSIEGVSTTTTGFVGPCRYGPVTALADIITSLGEFERTYAGGGKLEFLDSHGVEQGESDNYLWHAVRAFFSEGGKRLYVSRVFRPLHPTLPYPLPPLEGEKDVATGSEVLYADGHSRAEKIGIKVRSRFPGAASEMVVTITLKAGQNILAGEQVPGQPGLQPRLKSLMDRDLIFLARGATSLPGSSSSGEFYLAEFDPMTDLWSFTMLGSPDSQTFSLEKLQLHVSSTPTEGDSIYPMTVTVNVLSGDREHDLGTWSNLPLDPLHERFGQPDSVFAYFAVTPPTITLARTLPIIFAKPATGFTGLDVLHDLFGPDPGQLDAADDPGKMTVVKKLQGGVPCILELIGGNDGQRPGEADFAGQDVIEQNEETGAPFKTGLKQFEDVEDISIVAAPGFTADYEKFRNDANAIFGHLISHAQQMRYCIAVLDCPPNQGIADVRKVRAKLDSTHAAFYYPWVTVLDPITRRELNLPPSGFVTGIYARNDINRAVYKAPANEVVNLAIGFEKTLNKAQQEVLNPEGINCFRFFEGRGFRLWGARTISSDPEWKYVNLRRYFAYLERSIDKGTQWAVFEPNGYQLWANVRRTIEDFLLNEFQMGALLGEKPEQAYFVRCDRSTMTQNDLDNGRLVCLVGVAALRPAEFVIFRIGQWTSDRKT